MTTTNRTTTEAAIDQTTGEQPASRAFRIVSWIVALATLMLFGLGLTEIVLMWLPDGALETIFDETNPLELDYRSQFFHIGIVAWTIIPPLFMLLRRPERRAAPMLQVWLGAVALVVVMILIGGLEAIDIIVLGVFTLLAALFPARSELIRRPRFDRWQVGVLALGAAPWLVRAGVAVGDARDAGDFEVGDSPVRMVEGNVALAAALLLLVAAIGATDTSSWQLSAWTAAIASGLLGLHALVFPQQMASIPAPWAVAAICWGVAYAAATVRRSQVAATG
jgi:hypothetical protein